MLDKEKVELEKLIDHNTLADVLYELSIICYEKAEHIETTYGDGDSIPWDQAGDDIDELAQDTEI